jgi:hypothetical protein
MKKYLYIILSGLLTASCVDTALPPDDKTVDEDFWKKKEDVALMVNGAYSQMTSSDLITRLIVWSDFRSDELVQSTGITGGNIYQQLLQIFTGNIAVTNMYTSWQSFYSVINYCNIVIEKAAGVMAEDPNYTQGDYLNDVAQMKTLRSLCYFYLVRAFRDVPYITTAYMKNSQDMNISQSAPEVVLNGCIADLKEAAQNIIAPTAYDGWKSKGWLNRDAVYALLADIYLWKASIHHNDASYNSSDDYQQCINYCDLVIDSKNNAHVYKKSDVIDENDKYPALAKYNDDYDDLFITQNAEESIFEIQFSGQYENIGSNGTALGNNAICSMLYKYQNNNSGYGYFSAAGMFGIKGTSNVVFNQEYDGRKIKFIFDCNGDAMEQYTIRKMCTASTFTYGAPNAAGQKRQSDRTYNNFAQNYIVYRMTDVMLMKAEAMVQLATDGDIKLQEAFNVVKAVNDRAHTEGTVTMGDTLRWATSSSIQGNAINTKVGMEELVMEERLRELCFEGKRWYDLLRYNYRHTEGVNYNAILADQANFPANYRPMITLAARKSSDLSALYSKMPTEPYLYMPIREGELKVNPKLKQNPVYSSKTDAKNY